ncbi:FAD-dependent monooxygenase [bacterium]|nr:FAD-dependent monooxygenase [bacterium]
MENNKAEVIIVGAGPAGVSAAMTLAKAGKNVLLIDRADKAGDKNMFGGAIYAHQTEEIFPDFIQNAPIERNIVNQKIFMLNDKNSVQFEYYNPENKDTTFTVYRSKWDRWAVEQAINAGAYFAPKTLVKELLIQDGRVVGVQTGLEKFYADIVIIADGVNSLLAKQLDFRKEIKDYDVTLNVKEVIRLPQNIIEQRFNLRGDEGTACKILGGPLKGMFALGFLYTNADTISIGYGVGLDELKKNKIKPYELLDNLKSHPSMERLISGGEVIEYSAHMIPEGGYNSMPKLFGNGVLIAGDAAMFVNNIHMEGTNLAMLSGKLAAETAIEALNNSDFSQKTLSLYEKKLKESIVLKDLHLHKNTIKVLSKNIKTITAEYPELAAEFFDIITNADGIPKYIKYRKFFKKILFSGVILKSIPLALFILEKCIKK